MADEGKKISFGFSKSMKKPVLKSLLPQQPKKVDYIECLDGKAIKVIGEEEKKEAEPLVIPMAGPKIWYENMINKTDTDIVDLKPKPVENGVESDVRIKEEPADEPMQTDQPCDNRLDVTKVKSEDTREKEKVPTTLEEQAAREILQDLNTGDVNNAEPSVFTLPLAQNPTFTGEKESTLEDYENIPIEAYGMAMLRGMGWKPGKGIGKNEKLVEATTPSLRPKGMGLGADKSELQKANGHPKTKEEEELKIVTGAYVKIIAGKHRNNYGQIQGLDDDAGRLIVKMALGNEVISMNESVVSAVTKDEYLKNGKVLNATKYQEYKEKDNEGETAEVKLADSDQDERKSRRKRETTERKGSEKKKTKKSKRRSSDEDSSPLRKSRKRRSSESSDANENQKKSKKSKKHKSRDSSAERSSRKNRKKDKEREKRKDKRYSESPERRKQKKHKKSRSRSPRR